MREFEFRGKRVDNDEWVYGSLIIGKNESFICTLMSEDLKFKYGSSNNEVLIEKIYKVIPESVGQYIGRNDKNGKKIYEDSIVKFGKHVGVIKYYLGNVGGGRFVVEPNIDRNFYDEMGVLFAWNELEIIGNITNNPELLEDK